MTTQNNQIIIFNETNNYNLENGELIINLKNEGEYGKIGFTIDENNEIFLLNLNVPHYYRTKINTGDLKKTFQIFTDSKPIKDISKFPGTEFDGKLDVHFEIYLSAFHNSMGLNERSFKFKFDRDFLDFPIYIYPNTKIMKVKTSDYIDQNDNQWKRINYYDVFDEIKNDRVKFYVKNNVNFAQKTTNFISAKLNNVNKIYLQINEGALGKSEDHLKARVNINNIIVPKQRTIKNTARINFLKDISFDKDYRFINNQIYDYYHDMYCIYKHYFSNSLFSYMKNINNFLSKKKGIFCFYTFDDKNEPKFDQVYVRSATTFFMTKTLFDFATNEFWSNDKMLKVESALKILESYGFLKFTVVQGYNIINNYGIDLQKYIYEHNGLYVKIETLTSGKVFINNTPLSWDRQFIVNASNRAAVNTIINRRIYTDQKKIPK